jgi:hypothetical protein
MDLLSSLARALGVGCQGAIDERMRDWLLALDARATVSFNDQRGEGPYTITTGDKNRLVIIDATVTIPAALPAGFQVMIVQASPNPEMMIVDHSYTTVIGDPELALTSGKVSTITVKDDATLIFDGWTEDQNLTLTFDTTQPGSADDTFILSLLKTVDDPSVNYHFDYKVRDTDGSVVAEGTHATDEDLTIDGLTPGVFTLSIKAFDGDFGCLRFKDAEDALKVISLDSWGLVQWNNEFGEESLGAFLECLNLSLLAVDKPRFNCQSLRSFFYSCDNLPNADGVIDISDYDLSSALTSKTFLGKAGQAGPCTIDASGVKSGGSTYGFFFDCTTATELDVTGMDCSRSINAIIMFKGLDAMLDIIGLATVDFTNVTEMQQMFLETRSHSVLSWDVDMSAWNIGNVGSFEAMFAGRQSDGHVISGLDSLEPASLVNNALANFTHDGDLALSVECYDALLIKLASYLGSYTIGAQTMKVQSSKYTPGGAAEAARTALVGAGWTITDAGPVV